ncbi:hypothetical protein UB32_16420 [Mesobacillus subterraneus]|uniref:Uncharacterized protein n=1 Tax=Mesobacillus subterraneus TaxID=285983 RepID=A0A0D6Z5B5_9BACI|nr:hypothetical protein UB32_16420 [Mesobacillus subterraneus]
MESASLACVFAQAKTVINAYKGSGYKIEKGGKPYARIQTSLSNAGPEVGLWITIFRWLGWWIIGRSLVLPTAILWWFWWLWIPAIPAISNVPMLPAWILLLKNNRKGASRLASPLFI